MCASRRSPPSTMAAPDMLHSQKKKKTWQCLGGKVSKVILRASDVTAVNGERYCDDLTSSVSHLMYKMFILCAFLFISNYSFAHFYLVFVF